MESPILSTTGGEPSIAQLLKLGRGPTVDAPNKIVHKVFGDTAKRYPSAIAIKYASQTITYEALDEAASTLSHQLRKSGLRPRQSVVLLVQRSIPMVIAILAVLKSGCQYVPLDGGVASDVTLSHVLSDTQAKLVLCLGRYADRARKFVPHGTEVIVLDSTRNDLDDLSSEPHREVDVAPDDSAYTIYTSGSTGIPKGVEITHRNLTNLLTTSPGNLNICPGRKVGQLLSVAFDMAVWEIFATLLNGGTLCIRGSKWEDTLREIDTIIATPSILGSLKEEDYRNIKTVALAGEACPQALADQWTNGRNFYNCCGPTEVTIVNTMHKHVAGQRLSIGRPVPNTTVYILDENESPVPLGDVGLMWVGGACVSKGYVNLPELTRSRYKADKFLANGFKMFNTGDLGRWTEGGNLEPLGRIDEQVKIKGFRVELDGVAAVVEAHPQISRACISLVNGSLKCYYAAPKEIDESLLEEMASRTLPYYAIPSTWVWLADMPMTPNGKVDKKALNAFPWSNLDNEKSSVRLALADVSTSSQASTENSVYAQSQPSSQSSIQDIVDEKGLPTTTVEAVKLALPASQEFSPGDGFTLPPEKGAKTHIWLRYYFFTMYRRLFSLVFIGNLAAILTIFAYRSTLDKIRLSDLATATAANVTTALLMRQDYVINLLFTVACSVPTSMPLFLRRNCAKIFHIGGIHASAGVAAVFWFLILTVAATIGLVAPEKTSLGKTNPAIVVVAYLILALATSILVTAYPDFRAKRHNIFEMTHRFAGWSILILFWVITVLSAESTSKEPPYHALSHTLARSPTLYLLAISTLSVALPWLRLRKVVVNPEPLSSHAIRLHFDYTNTIPGTAVRISERPLLEWHAFATVAKPGVKGFSLVVSNAGDWTKRQIGRAPTKLWVRGIPACGVLRIVPLFKRVVLVATGSGIGPCLPVLLAKKVPMRVFWSAPNHKMTFGEEILDAVANADSKAVVWNTRERGKPDMVSEIWKLVAQEGKDERGRWNVEAVCVIANKKVTEMVVRGMDSRGMAAFGAIFDS